MSNLIGEKTFLVKHKEASPMSDSVLELIFPPIKGKQVVTRFDGGDVTSDAGMLWLARADLLDLTRV